MTNFILVPGMWLGAWAWDAVAEPLRGAGHDVTAVTLGGLAERAAEAGDATLDSHIADVVAAAGGRDEVTLVAHSYGGLPVRGAVERLAGRVARVVYVESGPVPDSTAQADFTPAPEAGGDVPPPSFDPADDPVLFAGLAGRSAWIRERATPHPWPAVAAPLRLRGPDQPPTELVCCTFTKETVEGMIAGGHPFFAGLDRRDYRVHELPTGHWPMFSRPADLAALLGGLGQGEP
ncbi:esterase/lipase family protein [Dactylosporangium sp. NPDC048998]|uniref:esterase/lipase family protein n=1 Tax=Dactylosporangium sp. NPDC048998 TaxID=3363976 RepID=UPI0037172AD0